MLKAYTSNAVYRPIGEALSNLDFEKIRFYLAAVFENSPKYRQSNDIKMVEKPVYRGINKYFFNKDDYQINSINFWPRFSSTSKDKRVARNFNAVNGETVIFEIFLSSKNDPPTSISLTGN